MRCLVVLVAIAALAAEDAATPPAAGSVLWNGRDLAGWHAIGTGTWTVEDGCLVGRHAAKDKTYGHLVSDAVYGDFTLAVRFKSVKGNSGLYFRVEEKGSSGISGFQAEIDPAKDVGGLYETNGRAWVVRPTAAQVATYFKPQDWNEMTVEARGQDVTVAVNGTVSAQLRGDRGRTQGRIALQVHGGQDCEVWFKDLRIQGAPLAPGPAP